MNDAPYVENQHNSNTSTTIVQTIGLVAEQSESRIMSEEGVKLLLTSALVEKHGVHSNIFIHAFSTQHHKLRDKDAFYFVRWKSLYPFLF